MSNKFLKLSDECYDKILEAQRVGYSSKLEKFEIYTARLKAERLKHDQEFLKSLHRGYKAVVQKVKAKEIAFK